MQLVDIFRQKAICGFRSNLCNCPESPSTLPTITSTEWKLFLPWSYHLAMSFRLETNTGSLSKYQNQKSDSDRYKRGFFTARESQVIVNAMEKFLEHRSEFHVTKGFFVHVVSGSYNVSSLELRNERKTTQQWGLCVTNSISLNQVLVYHERVYADKVVIRIWSLRSFFWLNITPKLLPTLLPNMCFRSQLKSG